MSGGGAVSGGVEGRGYVPNEDYWSGDSSLENESDKAAGEALMADWQFGSSIGSYGGMVGGIIGGIAGLVMGIVDATVTKKAVQNRLAKEKAERDALEKELKGVMDLRSETESALSAMLHPLEQAFRTRSKLHGASIRAQGLTGSQAVYAQLLAEEQYRQAIGPQLPAILREAKSAARESALTKIKAIELREGIILERQRLQLMQDIEASKASASFVGGLAKSAVSMGTMIGQMAAEGTQQQQQTSMGAGTSMSEGLNSLKGSGFGGVDVSGTKDVNEAQAMG